MRPIDHFYNTQDEPVKSIFMALRVCISGLDPEITEEWKYKLPFFYYKGKMFCYLWKDKKTQTPYIGIVKGDQIEHPALHQGNRKKMKALYLDPKEDLPVALIEKILKQLMKYYTV